MSQHTMILFSLLMQISGGISAATTFLLAHSSLTPHCLTLVTLPHCFDLSFLDAHRLENNCLLITKEIRPCKPRSNLINLGSPKDCHHWCKIAACSFMNSPVAGYIRPGHHAGPRAWLRDAKGAGLMNPWLEKKTEAQLRIYKQIGSSNWIILWVKWSQNFHEFQRKNLWVHQSTPKYKNTGFVTCQNTAATSLKCSWVKTPVS